MGDGVIMNTNRAIHCCWFAHRRKRQDRTWPLNADEQSVSRIRRWHRNNLCMPRSSVGKHVSIGKAVGRLAFVVATTMLKSRLTTLLPTSLYNRAPGTDGLYLSFPFLIHRDTGSNTKLLIGPVPYRAPSF